MAYFDDETTRKKKETSVSSFASVCPCHGK
jgi:hypothetical protein